MSAVIARLPDAELVLDADAVLAGAITFQGLEPVARGNPQIVEPPRDVELAKLAPRNLLDTHEPPDPIGTRQGLRVGVPE